MVSYAYEPWGGIFRILNFCFCGGVDFFVEWSDGDLVPT